MDGMNWDRQPESRRGNFLQQRSANYIAFLHSHWPIFLHLVNTKHDTLTQPSLLSRNLLHEWNPTPVPSTPLTLPIPLNHRHASLPPDQDDIA